MDLVNLAAGWESDADLARFIPGRHRDFRSTPSWSRKKAHAYLTNNLDLLRDSHRRLEAGGRLEYESLNHILGSCRIRLFDWGDPAALGSIRRSKASRGARLETLQALGDRSGLNPGTAFVKGCVERAFFYFAKYVDHRLDDPAYPDGSDGEFRILACVNPACGRLFVRTERGSLACGPACEAAG
jgi:hypothetical protein